MAEKERSSQDKLRQGFERLAFGSVTDAVRLLFEEGTTSSLEGMDLFNVSEIKRLKGGGMEIKFADRLKALQCLEQLELEHDGDGTAFYHALEASAACLKEENL